MCVEYILCMRKLSEIKLNLNEKVCHIITVINDCI